MKIKLYILRNYGRDFYYPDCDYSKMLCELLKQKTLTERDIKILQQNKFEIESEIIYPKRK